MRRIFALIVAATCAGAGGPRAAEHAAPDADIVIHASAISQGSLTGTWTLADDESAADGVTLVARTEGPTATDATAAGSRLTVPETNPIDYFDVSFTAPADTPYRLWLRVKTTGDERTDDDAVWVQFSDALVNGTPAYRIGTPDGLLVTVRPCSGCAGAGWGWRDTSWPLRQPATVTFANGGVHTLRIQAVSPGVELDHIVLSHRTYLNGPPGPAVDDATRVWTGSRGAVERTAPPEGRRPPAALDGPRA